MRASSRAAILIALAVLSLAAVAGPAQAKRLFVPRQYKGLQNAIDAASKGDTVWVGRGVYRGTITIRKPIVLFGDLGPDSTILDGGDSVRVLHIEGVKGATVIGFTIRRGKAAAGGGIFCSRDTSLMIASCKLTKNDNGAFAAWGCGDLNLRELQVEENEGSGVLFDTSTGIILNCAFERNKGYAGAALSLTNSRLFLPMKACAFEGNVAEATGGAINADSSSALVVECFFKDNEAKIAGGAVACMNQSSVNLSRCTFTENHAKTSGAIHSDHSTLNIAFCVIDHNRSLALGSALGYVGKAKTIIVPGIANNAFYKNTTEPDQDGATIFCESVSPEIRRNIVVVANGQKAVSGIESSPLYQCNLLYDPTGAATMSLPSTETLVGDPLFCDPDQGNYSLRDLSPAVLAPCGPIGPFPKGCTSFKMVPSK